jgi:DNA polymerase I
LVTAPHVAVAKILKRNGEDIKTGSTIGYVISEGGGKVSDRAKPVEGFNIKTYDKKYYIEHQIIPAVSRVMEALGYGEDELMGKKQGKLSEYFG